MPGWVASDMLNSLNNIFRTADLFCGQEAFATTVHSTSFAWAVRRVALSDHFLIDTGCDRPCPRQRSSSLARTSARKVRSSNRTSMPPRTRACPESSSGGDGVEASPHEVHMWCGSSKYARARAGAGGEVELWRNVDAVEWCVQITCEVQPKHFWVIFGKTHCSSKITKNDWKIMKRPQAGKPIYSDKSSK